MKFCLSSLSSGHSDYRFDRFFPEKIRMLSDRHWTPHLIAKDAANFLAHQPGTRVLDIGSGIGKFCLMAGYHYPETIFYGVEQRRELINLSQEAKAFYQIKNAHFIHGNFTEINFDNFDHFYFFNSFLENIDPTDAIDDLNKSLQLYSYYRNYLFEQLKKRPKGTRLATFDCDISQIPSSYQLTRISHSSLLKMWVKRY